MSVGSNDTSVAYPIHGHMFAKDSIDPLLTLGKMSLYGTLPQRASIGD